MRGDEKSGNRERGKEGEEREKGERGGEKGGGGRCSCDCAAIDCDFGVISGVISALFLPEFAKFARTFPFLRDVFDTEGAQTQRMLMKYSS